MRASLIGDAIAIMLRGVPHLNLNYARLAAPITKDILKRNGGRATGAASLKRAAKKRNAAKARASKR
jgi:hypothetical protein